MTKRESYNIYDILSFFLINNTKQLGLLSGINPEYKYFKSRKRCNSHFDIIVETPQNDSCDVNLQKGKQSWAIDIEKYSKNNSMTISPNNIGYRKTFSFTALKNLYVRSILMDKLLDANSALVHSAAIRVNEKTAILAGRPGVFKTSILMDAIRYHEASFIGEENCLISNKKVYPFPLNIDSISYKINNYKDENPSGKFQKVKLGLHLLKGNTNVSNLNLAPPSDIGTVLYLEKGDAFQIKSVSLDEILPDLIENEVLELSIPPTHSLSGIKYNFFKEIMQKHDKDFVDNFRNRLKQILYNNLSGKRYFRVISPQKYDLSITQEIVETINNN